MTIDIGKILKTSEDNYFKLTGENKSDYVLKKISLEVGRPILVKEEFAKRVPNSAEVVVNYHFMSKSPFSGYASGTALIPISDSSGDFFG